ncbi:MAG: PEP-CTERM sorting domain-containing protein [Akkermansiaceae bacterium]
MKNTITAITLTAILSSTSSAATVQLDNSSGGLGAALEAADFDFGDPELDLLVPEISGLTITVHGITTDGELNATATSLGINGSTDTDTDVFESAFNQSVTFSFDKTVSITQLDFTNFEATEVFVFGTETIIYDDLSNKSSDFYDFTTPLVINANTQFTLEATSGSIGIEAMTFTVVPEPSSTALLGLGGLAYILRRRK